MSDKPYLVGLLEYMQWIWSTWLSNIFNEWQVYDFFFFFFTADGTTLPSAKIFVILIWMVSPNMQFST